jgi:hypothetical protein
MAGGDARTTIPKGGFKKAKGSRPPAGKSSPEYKPLKNPNLFRKSF